MLKNNHLTSLCAVILAATALLFTSCVPENVGPDADLPKGAIRLTAPGYTPQNGSKLGVDNVGAQVFFAAGDRLWVNGEELTIAVNNGVAYITLPANVSSPIRMVYPYDIVDPDYTYDSESDNIPIKLPGEYTYATVQNGPGAGRQNVPAPLCAKIIVPGEGQTPAEVCFKHITAAITVAIENKTGAPMELEKIVVKSVERWNTWGEHTIDITNPNIDGANNSNGGNETKMSFPENSCLLENNGRTYIQIPILQLFNPVNTNQKTRLQIGVLAKNKLPGVIANKFYFEKTQANETFTISKGYLAYAPAYFDIDMEPTDPNYGLVVDGTYTISGTNANGKPRKVYFAQGNLRYHVGQNPVSAVNNPANVDFSIYSNPTTSNNWSFTTLQSDIVENVTNPLNSGSYVNVRVNNGYASQFLYAATGKDYSDIASQHPIYTPRAAVVSGHYLGNLERDNETDWGVRMGEKWFTLSNDDWTTIITRTDGRLIGRSLNGNNGMLLFPDKYGFTPSITDLQVFSTEREGSNAAISAETWAKMENSGVAFLPVAGYTYYYLHQQGINIRVPYHRGNNSEGRYWSSTCISNNVYFLQFSNSTDPSMEHKQYNTVSSTNNPLTATVRLAYPANF